MTLGGGDLLCLGNAGRREGERLRPAGPQLGGAGSLRPMAQPPRPAGQSCGERTRSTVSWGRGAALVWAPPPPSLRIAARWLLPCLPLQTWHLDVDVATKEHLPLSPGGLAPTHGLVLLRPRFTKIQIRLKLRRLFPLSPVTSVPHWLRGPGAGSPGRQGTRGADGGDLAVQWGQCPGRGPADAPRGPELICMCRFLYFVFNPHPTPRCDVP